MNKIPPEIYQHRCLLRIPDKLLCQLDMFYVSVVCITIDHLNFNILGLVKYFFMLMQCERKLRDAPCNEEAAGIKSKTLRCSYD